MPDAECTCSATDTVRAVYPTWASDDDISKAAQNGKENWVKNTAAAAAEAETKGIDFTTDTNSNETTNTDSTSTTTGEDTGNSDGSSTSDVTTTDEQKFVWPVCDSALTCQSGFYLNRLACKCFAMAHCNDLKCDTGSDLNPLELCTCATFAAIKDLYPTGVSLTDVQKSIEDGIAEAK